MIVVVSCYHSVDDERIYHKQIKSLLKKKYRIIYFTRSKTTLNLSNNFIKHENFDINTNINSFIKTVWNYLKDENQISHVQIHETDLLPLLKLIKSNRKKIKTIYDIHELREPLYRTFSKKPHLITELSIFFRNKKEFYYMKYVDNIILANPLHSENPYLKFDIPTIVIENFVEKKYITTLLNNQKTPSLVYHGHLGEYRGISDLVKAVQIVLQTIPETRLTLVGVFRNVQFGMKLNKYLKENKITDSIKIVDQKPHSEIWEVLQNHSIGIIPFRKNQFSLNCTPTKLFEMMASGLEIVATELPPIKHFVKDTIHWARPNDISSLSDSIKNAIHAKSESLYVRKNLSLVKEKYNWENIEQDYLNLFS